MDAKRKPLVRGNLQDIVRGRRRCTNESHAQALEAIRATKPNAPLIPVAAPGQAEFETEVLGAIGYGIDPQNLNIGTRHPFGVLSAIPREQSLELVLGDHKGTLQEFSSRVSPCVRDTPGGLTGIEGLRVKFTKRNAILYRLHGPGTVVLRDISEKAWNNALLTSWGSDVFKSGYLGSAPRLHEDERETLKLYPRCTDFPHTTHVGELVLSGLLRRPHVFRAESQMRFTDLWFNFMNDCVVINLEWAGDVPHLALMQRLLDSRFGLPLKVAVPEQCYCEPCMTSSRTYSVKLQDTLGGNVTLQLRRSSLYEEVLPAQKSGPCQFRAPVDAIGAPITGGGARVVR